MLGVNRVCVIKHCSCWELIEFCYQTLSMLGVNRVCVIKHSPCWELIEFVLSNTVHVGI